MSVLILFVALQIEGHSSKNKTSLNADQENNGNCLKRHDAQGRPRWLATRELMNRVIEKREVDRPGALGKNNLRGVVTVQVVINKKGRVVCTHGIKGHPLAIASVEHSLREWTFRPYLSHGKSKSMAGVLNVPFDFSK